MKNTAISLFTIGLLSTSNATAQSLPDNMYFDGHVEITRMHFTGIDESFGQASLNFGLIPTRDSRLAIGFSLGVDALNLNDFGVSETAVYPAVTFALGNNGLLSVGVPRPVLSYGYIPKDTLAHSEGVRVLLESSGIAPSFVSIAYLYGPALFGGDVDMYGLRYDGEFGNTKIGASYHHVRTGGGGGDADVYSIAFQHRLGAIGSVADTMVFGGVESIDTGTDRLTSYTLGVEASSDKLRAGLILARTELAGDFTTANLYADYKITDRFSVAGSILHLDPGGGSSNIYGVGIEYQFLNGGYVNANYSDQDIFGGDAFYEVSLGWRF